MKTMVITCVMCIFLARVCSDVRPHLTQFTTVMQGSGSQAQGEISFVSWNSKAQHIFASTSYNGTTGEKR